MNDRQRSFEIEFLQAKLSEVEEAIASLRRGDGSVDADGRCRLAALEQRLRSALASYELDAQTR